MSIKLLAEKIQQWRIGINSADIETVVREGARH